MSAGSFCEASNAGIQTEIIDKIGGAIKTAKIYLIFNKFNS